MSDTPDNVIEIPLSPHDSSETYAVRASSVYAVTRFERDERLGANRDGPIERHYCIQLRVIRSGFHDCPTGCYLTARERDAVYDRIIEMMRWSPDN